jgi:flagellar biosynthesis protein FliQ
MIGVLLIIGFVIAFLQSRNRYFEKKIENDPKIMAVTVSILALVSIVLLDCFGCSIDCCMVFYCEGCTPIIKN